jgi:antirestriction protein ArdC
MPFAVTTDRTAELIAKLEGLIIELTSSDRWIEFLRAMGRFHDYSANNVLLILSQKPEATRCAGFRTWLSLHRAVRPGERAIYVLGPCTRRITVEDEDGAERTTTRVTGFKAVPTFDISQTDGQPLPTAVHPLLGAAPPHLLTKLVAFGEAHGYRVEIVDQDRLGSANGRCIPGAHLIEISRDLSPLMTVKTVIHECGHLLLHSAMPASADLDRPLAELEAESTAYIVMQNLLVDGRVLDSASYSTGYVAHWAGGGSEAIAGLRASAERIGKAARSILDALAGDTDSVS